MWLNRADVLHLIETVEGLREELTLTQLKLEDQGWVSLSGGFVDKRITTEEYLENHRACYQAYLTNPLAQRYVRYMTYFVAGDGVQVTAEDEAVSEILRGFWVDEENEMDKFVMDVSDWLAICGECFIRFFYDEYLGETRVGLIDPAEIRHIETDPDNVKRPVRFYREYTVPVVEVSGDRFEIRTIDRTEIIEAVREDGLLNVHQIKVGGVSNSVRGVSDLLNVIVWMERYRQWLEDRALLNKMRNLFHYDVTIEGGTKQDVKDYLASLKGRKIGNLRDDYSDASTAERIRPGSIRVHSDRVKWDTVQPRIDAADAKEDGRAIKLMVAAGMGIPEHWLGDTGNTNLATAKALDLPTLRQFQNRQRTLRRTVQTIIKQVINCQRLYGSLPAKPAKGKDPLNTKFHVEFPPIEIEDLKAKAETLRAVSDAVMALADRKMVSRDTANKVLRQYEPLIREWGGEDGEREKIDEENPVERQAGIVPPGMLGYEQ